MAQPTPSCNNGRYSIRAEHPAGNQVLSHLEISMYLMSSPRTYQLYSEVCGQMASLKITHFQVHLVFDGDSITIDQLELSRGTYRFSALRINHFFSVLKFDIISSDSIKPLKFNPRALKSQLKALTSILSIRFGRPVNIPEKPLFGESTFSEEIYVLYINQFKRLISCLKIEFPTIFNRENASNEDCPYLKSLELLCEYILSMKLENHAGKIRTNHIKLLRLLREVVNFEEIQDPPAIAMQVRRYVDEITLWMYTRAYQSESPKRLFFSLIPDLQRYPHNDLVNDLIYAYEDLLYHPQLVGSYESQHCEPHNNGDLSYSTWFWERAGGRNSAQFIQMGHAAAHYLPHEPSWGYIVLPEFLHFIRVLQQKGKSFLYINFMRTKDPVQSQGEGLMTDVIHRLETQYRFEHVRVISLDRNSLFYLQDSSIFSREAWVLLNNCAFYKELLLYHLFDEDGECPCRWPQRENILDVKNLLRVIIEQVHAQYFGSCEILTPTQRTAFYDLVLVEYVASLLTEGNHDYFTTTAQSFTEIGSLFAALLELKQLSRKGPVKKPEEITRIIESAFKNSILVENKAPSPLRFEIFITAVKHMQERSQVSEI